MLLKREEKIYLQYCIVSVEKNLHISGPVHLKPVLFKGQWYFLSHCLVSVQWVFFPKVS